MFATRLCRRLFFLWFGFCGVLRFLLLLSWALLLLFSDRNASPGCDAFHGGSYSREPGGDVRLKAGPFCGRPRLFLLPGAAGFGGGKGKSCFCHLSRESLLHKGVRDIWKKRGTSTQSCSRRTRGAALMFFLNCSTFKRGQFRYILICYTVLN